jgi:hypothetical protein
MIPLAMFFPICLLLGVLEFSQKSHGKWCSQMCVLQTHRRDQLGCNLTLILRELFFNKKTRIKRWGWRERGRDRDRKETDRQREREREIGFNLEMWFIQNPTLGFSTTD